MQLDFLKSWVPRRSLWLGQTLNLIFVSVLVLTGIKLIFRRSWEKPQPGQLTQTGQRDIQYHTTSPSGYKCNHCSGAGWALGSGWCTIALCSTHFVYSLSSIIVTNSLFLCCPIKLSLLKPRVLPFSSDSPPHPTGGRRSEQVAAWYFIASWG